MNTKDLYEIRYGRVAEYIDGGIVKTRRIAGIHAKKQPRNPKCPIYKDGKLLGHVVYNELSEKLFWHHPTKKGAEIYTMYADGRLKSKMKW